jgi:hypothetical protein
VIWSGAPDILSSNQRRVKLREVLCRHWVGFLLFLKIMRKLKEVNLVLQLDRLYLARIDWFINHDENNITDSAHAS